ncbi:unnamed protein product, partial [Cylicostephanus goldi]
MPYFTTHMQSLLEHYGSPLVVVNLVDQAGRELKLAKSFVEIVKRWFAAQACLNSLPGAAIKEMAASASTTICKGPIIGFIHALIILQVAFQHAVKFDSPNLHFVSFDLHRQCRGLKFDKINDLVSRLHELLGEISYCWVDKTGEVVKTQRGVVRTNCIDCLDRTNLVQGAISQWVCMQQAQRLGLFGPLCEPPEALVLLLQNMWADNGDAISTQVCLSVGSGGVERAVIQSFFRDFSVNQYLFKCSQYAGTAALKGDVTRSGERRFAGIMKDGYNSASRYYLSH